MWSAASWPTQVVSRLFFSPPAENSGMSIEEHELDNLNDEADVGAYDYEAPLTTPSSAPVWSAPTSSSTGYTYTPPASLAIPKAPAPPAAVKTAGFSSSSTTPRMPATPPSPKRPAAHAYNVPAVAGILHGDPDGIHGSASVTDERQGAVADRLFLPRDL